MLRQCLLGNCMCEVLTKAEMGAGTHKKWER